MNWDWFVCFFVSVHSISLFVKSNKEVGTVHLQTMSKVDLMTRDHMFDFMYRG